MMMVMMVVMVVVMVDVMTMTMVVDVVVADDTGVRSLRGGNDALTVMLQKGSV